MKTITFVYPQMVMGGAEKALLRLIGKTDKSRYRVNVILMKRGGELEHDFPNDVQVDYSETTSPVSSLKNGRLAEFLKGLYCRLQIRLRHTYEEKSYYLSRIRRVPDTISADCAICYSHFNFLSICTTAFSQAKTKILWVHSFFREDMNRKLYEEILGYFDYFCCVSKAVKDEFDRLFPMHANKSKVIYNLIDENEIKEMAEEEIEERMDPISIVTIGRLSPEKGQQMIPAVAKKLIDNKNSINWYIVGG